MRHVLVAVLRSQSRAARARELSAYELADPPPGYEPTPKARRRGSFRKKLPNGRWARWYDPEVTAPVQPVETPQGTAQPGAAPRPKGGAAVKPKKTPGQGQPRQKRPPQSVIEPSNETVRNYRESHLLLQLLKSPAGRLGGEDLRRLGAAGRNLDMNRATARSVLLSLAGRGLVKAEGVSGRESFELTDAGKAALAESLFEESATISLKGKTLNALLDAARGRGQKAKKQDRPATREEVAREVEAAFSELLREHHTLGMVPIHEIRQAVREKLGDGAASRGVFDDIILGLRHRGYRLTPITNRSLVTAKQLQDSVDGLGETLFFLEKDGGR